VAGNPRRNALFGVVSETCGLRRLDGGEVGLELVTHHPVIEPVSAPRRERKFPTKRQAGKSRLIT